jgi:nitric oxide reductase subunit B
VVPLRAGAHLAHPERAVLDRHRLLAAGLFLAPLINGGKDPKYQKLGVDILFWALVVVCVGSFIGNYLAIAQLPPEWNFWLGHQGYEYVDLGRLWQIGKFAGIAFWLVLMARGIFPALLAPAARTRTCWRC